MRRFTTTAPMALLLLIAMVGSVSAHGGQYRGPNDKVPPRLREPDDPRSIPPPPPYGPGVRPKPPPVAPVDPTPPWENSNLGYDNWVFWYHHNRPGLETLKKSIYSRVGSGPLSRLGGRSRTNRSDATHDIRALVDREIAPALLRVMAAKRIHQDVRSAAYIGLGKLAKDAAQIKLIKKGLDPEEKNDLIVQESAAIGLGLLRRRDASGQFDAAELDEVRAFLFRVFEDDRNYLGRTRGFAALAIGLLGDQPSGSSSYAGPSATTARLFSLLKHKYVHPDMAIGLLLAIGLQPVTSVTRQQRQILRDCVTKGRLHKLEVLSLIRSYAALTLGRVGHAEDIAVLRWALTSGYIKHMNITRSCAIGLGQLGRRVTGKDRIQAAKALLDSLSTLNDASARNFAVIGLAGLIIADVEAGKTDIVDATKADELILKLAADGEPIRRPFGALALGLIGAAIAEETTVAAHGALRARSLDVLRSGLRSMKLDMRVRAAFATSLGLMRDSTVVGELTAIVADKKEDRELRGFAALSLGLIGQATREVLSTIRDALKEHDPEELRLRYRWSMRDELRRHSATALCLLQDEQGVQVLLAELEKHKGRRSWRTRGDAVLALAPIGDARVVKPLVTVLGDEQESDLMLAMACGALGTAGDLEWRPSLSYLTNHLNYRAQCDLIAELLSLL